MSDHASPRWSPGSGLVFRLVRGPAALPSDDPNANPREHRLSMQSATYHPEMIEWVHDQGASYQCPDCDERLVVHTDVVVYDARPAFAVELACSHDDCGFVTRGLAPTVPPDE